jgi:hypothetical protein
MRPPLAGVAPPTHIPASSGRFPGLSLILIGECDAAAQKDTNVRATVGSQLDFRLKDVSSQIDGSRKSD